MKRIFKLKELILSVFVLLLGLNSISQVTITLQPDSIDGKDSYIHDLDVNENLGDHQDFASIAWTCSGELCIARNLIDFDFSSIPLGAVIVNARLTLFHNPTTPNTGHTTGGLNRSVLQRITTDWKEFTVTWNNQPYTTTSHEVVLPASINYNQDYTDLDVTLIVQDLIDNPTTGHGIMLKLETEHFYRSLIFASSDHLDSTLHPKLEISYLTPVSIINKDTEISLFYLYPNPTSGVFNIDFDMIEDVSVKILNIYGQTVFAQDINKENNSINISGFPNGIYFIFLKKDSFMHSERIIKL